MPEIKERKWILGKLSLSKKLLPYWLDSPKDFQLWIDESAITIPEPSINVKTSLKISESSYLPLVYEAKNNMRLTFDWPKMRKQILFEHHLPLQEHPLVHKIPFNYNNMPQKLISAGRFIFNKLKNPRGKNNSCYDANLTIHLLDHLYDYTNEKAIEKSRSASLSPFFLTYDTDQGWIFEQDYLFEKILDDLNSLGIKATWFVVPFYSQSHSIQKKLDRLLNEGHEVGMHGIRHECRLPFASVNNMIKAFNDWKYFIEDYEISGFRSPWLITTPDLMRVLCKFFSYDSSIPTTSYFTNFDKPRGCCYTNPFKMGTLIELPVSLPSHDELLRFGYSSEEMDSFWLNHVGLICSMAGTPVMIEHWDPDHLGRTDLYDRHIALLSKIAKSCNCSKLPATWLRKYFF